VFVIEGPLILGRAPHADVQIVEDGVSRQHARITADDQGRVMITDLQSASGTKVGGRRIDKKQLRPGETVQIGEARFVYEIRQGELITSPSFVDKTSTAEALHRTNPGVAASQRARGPASGAPGVYHPGSGGAVPGVRPDGPPAPRRPPRRPTPLTGTPRQPLTGPGSEPPRNEPHRPVGHGLSSGAPRAPIGWQDDPVSDEGPGLPTVDLNQGVAELAQLFYETNGGTREPSGRFSLRTEPPSPIPADGPTLSGPDFVALMDRILHYHALAAQLTRREPLDDNAQQALAGYEAEFRHESERAEDRRQWRRFPVRAHANAVWFRDLRSRSIDIHLLDISASGVCFESGERVFDHGDVMSLLVFMPEAEQRQAVFSGRITWVSGDRDRCGAIFVGPGTWQPPS
jgi:hypothetical protein